MTHAVDAPNRILVAADRRDAADAIVEDLRTEFKCIRASTDAGRASEEFEDYVPDVLVLAFAELAKAMNYCGALHRQGIASPSHEYRSIILCSRSECAAVVDLCKKGQFDDYVLYWPQPYDGFRLAASIRIASREMTAAKSHRGRPLDLLAHARNADDLDRILEGELGDTDRQAVEIMHSLAATERDIDSVIENFSNRLSDESSDGWIDVTRRDVLAREIGQLRERHLERARRSGAAEIESARTRTRQVKDKLEPSLAGVRALVDEFRKVKPVVMIVEDDEFSRELVSRALDPDAWDMVFAIDGPTALNQLRRTRPDVILMDVRLPGMDGLVLTHRIKSSPHLADIPVIMMTGDARKETLLGSLAAGAAGFVVKPFTRAVLTAKLEKLVPR